MLQHNSPYQSFEEIEALERPDHDYKIICKARESDTSVIAIHGGGIEAGTAEVAEAVAGEELSFYSFMGMRAPNSRLHVSSHLFDEPVCTELVGKSKHTISIHGCMGAEETVFVGGLDTLLRPVAREFLLAAGFHADKAPEKLAGMDPLNICNRNQRGMGLQLELTFGLRKLLLGSPDALLRFSNAVLSALKFISSKEIQTARFG